MRHLDALNVGNQAVVLESRLPPGHSDQSLQALVTSAWDLDSIEAAYADYVATFLPIQRLLARGRTVAPEDAFYIRTFMIHEYRKVLLRDPALPDALLPPSWKGFAAYRLTQDLYRRVVAPAERFIDASFETQIGSLPPPNPAFSNRFGGLRHAAS